MTSLAVLLYFGVGSFLRNLVSLGVLIAFINLLRKFFHPVRDMADKYNILQCAMAGSERVFPLLDENASLPQPKNDLKMAKGRGSIVFDNVSFAYNPGEWVLNDLSFEVQPGETVVVVGCTGAGKTTITPRLTRLWDIQRGHILIDGIDIRNIRTDVLRRKVQSVLQDVFIFSGTMAENIALGSDIPMETIEQAAKLVRADSFIDKLPDGYSTALAERGSNFLRASASCSRSPG